METDTNFIDRSIAHLLFHRPSNSSVMADSLALKSPSMVGVSAHTSKFHVQQSVSQTIPCNFSVNRFSRHYLALQ